MSFSIAAPLSFQHHDDGINKVLLRGQRNLPTEVMYQVRAVPTGRNTETRRCLTAKELDEYGVINAEWES